MVETLHRNPTPNEEAKLRDLANRIQKETKEWRSKEMEYMGYMGNYRHLEQAVAEIQAGLPVQLRARSGAAGRAARHWPSASRFRLRPNYAVPSGLSGNPASACRATARKGRKLNALLAALLFAASGAAQAKSIT